MMRKESKWLYLSHLEPAADLPEPSGGACFSVEAYMRSSVEAIKERHAGGGGKEKKINDCRQLSP